MPCFNAEATVADALASLLQQTLPDFELILVDDGSTDHSTDILNHFANLDHRIHILSLPHQGILGALNAGLRKCQAPLIARMDADDLSHPERLQEQVNYLGKHPEIAVVSCLVEGFPTERLQQGFRFYIDWLNSLVTDEDIRREIFVESPLVHPSVMIRHTWLERVGGYEEHNWPEDYDLWLRLYLLGARFAKVPLHLFQWRDDPHRLTRVDPRYSLENFLRAKTLYLARGPLVGRDAVILWGAGMMGRHLSRHLQTQDIPLVAFIDIDPRKIGRTRRMLPILSPNELPSVWKRYHSPALLTAVGTRGARPLIRKKLIQLGLCEGLDWWHVA
jgi:glycosyltransferase involved in cell wall biosynthesis